MMGGSQVWRFYHPDQPLVIPEPKQLESSTWSFVTITGELTVGQGSDPVDYNNDYEGQVANSGNSEFHVNNWSPSVYWSPQSPSACQGVSGGWALLCYAPVVFDLGTRIFRPAPPSANPNVHWGMTMGVHNEVMDPVNFNIWTTHPDVE
jgi:hypothetical protein